MKPDVRPPDPTPWAVGDDALCIRQNGTWYTPSLDIKVDGPTAGEVHKVVNIIYRRFLTTDYQVLELTMLRFARYAPCYYASDSFVKIEPHTEDEEDRETLRLYKNAPVPETVE